MPELVETHPKPLWKYLLGAIAIAAVIAYAAYSGFRDGKEHRSGDRSEQANAGT